MRKITISNVVYATIRMVVLGFFLVLLLSADVHKYLSYLGLIVIAINAIAIVVHPKNILFSIEVIIIAYLNFVPNLSIVGDVLLTGKFVPLSDVFVRDAVILGLSVLDLLGVRIADYLDNFIQSKVETRNSYHKPREEFNRTYSADYEEKTFEEKAKMFEEYFRSVNDARRKRVEENCGKYEDAKRRENLQKTEDTQNFFAGCLSKESVKKRFKELCKVYHPDLADGSTEMMKLINAQYNILLRKYA